MSAAGGLRIELTSDGERFRNVALRSTRPATARLLVGRSPEEALRRVPALFSLCGHAQSVAAAAALSAAGAPVRRADPAAEERALAAEMAQEHLWRLMLDWPALFGQISRRACFAALHRGLGRLAGRDAAFELGGELLDLVAAELPGGFPDAACVPPAPGRLGAPARRGGSLGAVLADLLELEAAVPAVGSVARRVQLLPALPAREWARRLGGVPLPRFQAAPLLDGSPRETGVVARHAESPMVRTLLARGQRIAARLFARVIDLADCATRLRYPLCAELPRLVDAAPMGTEGDDVDGEAVASVETARGLLLHAVRLHGGRIADYAIIAPTEWNFHPRGVFALEAGAMPAGSRDLVLRRLRSLVLALDPCVPVEIVLEEEAAHA